MAYQLRLGEGDDDQRGDEVGRGQGHANTERGLSRGDILNPTEVAELLQLRRSTVEDYARRGLLPSIKLGRFRRFVRADVEAALAQLRNGGAD
jgi:excisionase family DNA binding protein